MGRATRALAHRSAYGDLDVLFAALADATRRDIIRSLLDEPKRAGDLARDVAVSPQALSRHLRVLRKIGLVVEQGMEQDARVRIYSLRLIALEPMQEWFWRVEDEWRRQWEILPPYAESVRRGHRSRSWAPRRTRS